MSMQVPRLSCADFTFPLLPHAAALRLIASMDFTAVDIGLFTGRSHLRPEQVAGQPAEHGRTLNKMLADCGLALSDLFVQLGEDPAQHAASEPDAAIRAADRDQFLRCLDFARAAGAAHVTGLPGVPTADGIGRAVEETAWRLDVATRAGLRYAIEPHVGSNCPTVPDALAFLAGVPGLTVTLDYGHFVYQRQPPDVAHALLKHASHFHARSGAPGRLQAALSANAIDFAPMIQHAMQSEQTICVEYVWVDWEHCNEVDNVSETILMRDHLQSIAAGELKENECG